MLVANFTILEMIVVPLKLYAFRATYKNKEKKNNIPIENKR